MSGADARRGGILYNVSRTYSTTNLFLLVATSPREDDGCEQGEECGGDDDDT